MTELTGAPTYDYAGASMSGENVMWCGQCGVLLREDMTPTHTYWHERLDTVFAQSDEAIKDAVKDTVADTSHLYDPDEAQKFIDAGA